MTAQSKFGMSLNSIIHTTLRDRQVLLGSFWMISMKITVLPNITLSQIALDFSSSVNIGRI